MPSALKVQILQRQSAEQAVVMGPASGQNRLSGYLHAWRLPPDQAEAARPRLRWQVELAIKRWKSLRDLDRLRAKEGSTLAQVWLHGKLLYALLLERRARRLGGEQWGYLDRPRQATWLRQWKLRAQALAPLSTGAAHWQAAHWGACIEVMQERPRRRQLQRLPAALLRLVRGACPAEIASLLPLAA